MPRPLETTQTDVLSFSDVQADLYLRSLWHDVRADPPALTNRRLLPFYYGFVLKRLCHCIYNVFNIHRINRMHFLQIQFLVWRMALMGKILEY